MARRNQGISNTRSAREKNFRPYLLERVGH